MEWKLQVTREPQWAWKCVQSAIYNWKYCPRGILLECHALLQLKQCRFILKNWLVHLRMSDTQRPILQTSVQLHPSPDTRASGGPSQKGPYEFLWEATSKCYRLIKPSICSLWTDFPEAFSFFSYPFSHTHTYA